MLTGRLGARISTWIEAVDASQLPGLTGFALHLLRDLEDGAEAQPFRWPLMEDGHR
ncbi:hypothetical protein [Streptomyces sp. NPDC056544]|uniref:hypothetical protein n=1 Tax=unclassified Streptomyces TaxID=2593676 RepID=UPI0036755460